MKQHPNDADNHAPRAAPQPAPHELDEARLTAYALGELDGAAHAADRAAVEASLASDPAARAALDEIRALAAVLTADLAAEAAQPAEAAALSAAQHRAIEAAMPPATATGGSLRWMRFVPALAAAALIAVLVWHEPAGPKQQSPGAFAARDTNGTQDREAPFAPADTSVPGTSALLAVAGAGEVGEVESRTGAAAPVEGAAPGTDLIHGRDKAGGATLVLAGESSPADDARFAATSAARAAGEAGSATPRDPAIGETAVVAEDALIADAVAKAAAGDESLHQLMRSVGYLSSEAPTQTPAPPASGASTASPPEPGRQGFGKAALTGRGRPPAANNAPAGGLESLGYLGAAKAPADGAAARGGELGIHEGHRYIHTPGGEGYEPIVESGFQSPLVAPRSTFSVDVDTASYANVRRFLNAGQLPPADAVRIEELLNYFRYDYPQPDGEHPFSVTADVAPCPWAPGHRLVRLGLQGRTLQETERAPSNLVFLVDVSGSMNSADKLPLVQASLRMLVGRLDARDRIALVTYSGNASLVLDSTSGANKPAILDALDRLQADGSTAGGAGITLAYDVAARHFIKGGTNRVILASDGDFNVGATSREALQSLIERSAKGGVFLTVLGYGTGNLQDGTAELLANKGNGNYAYIDTLAEAQKVLVQQMGGTLVTIAKDVKLQVEFNPGRVAAYRLLGYENRALATRDFNDDRKDAGEIGAGHSVTALYEIIPVGVGGVPAPDALRYQAEAPAAVAPPVLNDSPELLYVALRYKQPDADTSTLLGQPLVDEAAAVGTGGALSGDMAFAAAVAQFGMLLRGSEYAGHASWDSVRALAEAGRGADRDGYRAEFIRLADIAASLDTQAFLRGIGY